MIVVKGHDDVVVHALVQESRAVIHWLLMAAMRQLAAEVRKQNTEMSPPDEKS